MKTIKFHIILLLGLLSNSCETTINKSSMQEIDFKVDSLLNKMTLDEKIGQMNQLMNFVDTLPIDSYFYNLIKEGKIGSVLNSFSPEITREMQRIAVEESRLGIPLLVGRDVIHGYRTIFPVNIGLAATFNPELIQETARIAAMEARSEGINWTFAPMMDISRDPRWGRMAESCGEDPYLTEQMAVANIKGFQGDNLSSKNSIAATAKHYVGYGAAIGGRDYNTTLIPETELRNVYLRPFKAAVDANVATVMSGFNELNGVPTSGNEYTINEILKEEWNFNGFVVSDWASIKNLAVHGYAKDTTDATIKALQAGVDMDMCSYHYLKNLKNLVNNRIINEELIDNAVRRILQTKFQLGLFENPYATEENKLLSEQALDIAKDAVIQSTVLLQNKNKTLPLSKDIKKVAVIGPLADAPYEQLGTWVFDGKEENSITPLTALKEFLGEKRINYATGLEISRTKNKDGFADAIKAAKNSDVVLLFMGDESILTGEAHCRAELTLPGYQNELIQEISKLGKPTVLVIMTGVILMVEPYLNQVDALLYGWHPGTMGGAGYVDLLFGIESPSGKLPMTFPRTEGQIPIYYNHNNTGHPATDESWVRMYDIPVQAWQTSLGNTNHYLDYGFEPLFEFGFGLSYTEFKYTDIKLSKKVMSMNDSLVVTAHIKNLGGFLAEDVAQLYIRDLVGSIVRPVKELKRFKRVRLNPGEEKEVDFVLYPKDFEFHNGKEWVIEPGEFNIWVGNSSKATLMAEFELK
ncbi:MAG: glycosyl hydrolase [Bacteroidetes bacterium GWF2_33_16]|nr:MAG: glycosyl hydrolase [Bacteroidetes bacterium GWE2_32_14]OFY05522.1 MAG: glycosyl hydrolase [Bacteroidetes bacterium GWF2_33_16]